MMVNTGHTTTSTYKRSAINHGQSASMTTVSSVKSGTQQTWLKQVIRHIEKIVCS